MVTSNADEMLKDAIKQGRKELKLDTGEFGKLLGVSKRTIEAYECGLRTPSISVLILLKQIQRKIKNKARRNPK